jgi:hypothetical protein
VVAGAVLALCSLGVLGAGSAGVWAETSQRSGGYVNLATASYATAGHALASGAIGAHGGWEWLGPLVGQVRIKVTQTGRGSGVFAGVASAAAARRYLAGVAYTTVTGYPGQGSVRHPGLVVPRPPGSASIWTAKAAGARTASLLWTVRDGDWAVVVMNADGSAGIAVRAQVGASFPALGWLAAELLAGGVMLALVAVACIIVPVRLAAAASQADVPVAAGAEAAPRRP